MNTIQPCRLQLRRAPDPDTLTLTLTLTLTMTFKSNLNP